jgi:hypothetical protein
LGEVVWDIASDPVGIGTAIVEGVADGATKARDWMMDGENWKNAAESSWDYVTSPDKWAETAKDAAAWVQDNPRTLGNVTGEIAETAAEIAFTGGAATAAKKVTMEAAERATREAAERAAREAAEKAAREAAEREAREAAGKAVKKTVPRVITVSLRESIEQSRKAFQKAIDAAKKLPNSQKGKTVASDGFKTVSGYADGRISKKTRDAIENVKDVKPDDIMHKSKNEFGYDPKTNKSLDNGNPGSASASHAEKQLMHETDDAIGVNRKMCQCCRKYAQAKANKTGKDVIVTDPDGTKIFRPGRKRPIDIGHGDPADFGFD